MKFFRIGETPFNRLAAQAVQFFSTDRVGVDPNLFLIRLPNMSRDRPLCRVRRKTVGTQWTIGTVLPSAFIVAIARPIRRGVREFTSHWTRIGIHRFHIRKSTFREPRILVLETAIAHCDEDAGLLKTHANMPCEIPGIECNGFDRKAEFLCLVFQSLEIRIRIVDVARRDKGVGDEIVLGIHRPVVEVEETLWLVVPHQETAVGIRLTDPRQRRFFVQSRTDRFRL